MIVAPGAPYISRLPLGAALTGLTGTVRFRLLDNDTTVNDPVYGPSTASIIEDPTGSGSYLFHGTAPSTAGTYSPAWDRGAGTDLIYDDDLTVTTAAAIVVASASYYITAAQLKATADLADTSFANDDINAAIHAACREIDAATGRRFWLDPDNTSERLYTPDSARILMIDDVVDLQAVDIDRTGDGTFEESWTVGTDFVLRPANAAADGRPYEEIWTRRNRGRYLPCGLEDSVRVTGQFGWVAVPDVIVQATTILAGRLVRRSREAPLGIVTFGVEAEAAIRIARTDPDVAALISDLNRHTPFI
jgi:hypothetical protein